MGFLDTLQNFSKRFFQPLTHFYNNRIWGTKTAVWVDIENAFELYQTIPELRAVLNRRASMMSLNKPVLVNKKGEVVENHWMNKLLKKPNPTQSWSDVVYSLSVNDGLYSNAFAFSPKRVSGIRNLFLPLPSDKVKTNLSGKKLKQLDKSGLIDNFTFEYDSDVEDLEFDDVVYFNTPDGFNIVNPTSRLTSLKYPLSNIKAQYYKRNVLLENITPIGIISAQNSDIGGAIPMTPEEKTELQKSVLRRNKDEIIVTEANAKWEPMAFPTKDLMLFEELTADKLALIDGYGLSYYIFSSEKGSTYANVRDGIRMTYNDTIIPETQAMYDTITEQFGLDKDGLRLVADFSHIPVLQADESLKSKSFSQKAKAIRDLKEAGVELTPEQIESILDL